MYYCWRSRLSLIGQKCFIEHANSDKELCCCKEEFFFFQLVRVLLDDGPLSFEHPSKQIAWEDGILYANNSFWNFFLVTKYPIISPCSVRQVNSALQIGNALCTSAHVAGRCATQLQELFNRDCQERWNTWHRLTGCLSQCIWLL